MKKQNRTRIAREIRAECFMNVLSRHLRPANDLRVSCDKSLLFLQEKIDFWDPYPLELSKDGILKFLE
ncbi:hypothetical protein AMK06_CH00636 [Rhizobium sp. N541]|nr:hypothetical protein AMK06_CH00636 [Rhizobium sp. N541]ANM21966.1 hypothetical protein AMK07_CH00636 [Rhizobium sp. N941]